jgi:hypothetical protein
MHKNFGRKIPNFCWYKVLQKKNKKNTEGNVWRKGEWKRSGTKAKEIVMYNMKEHKMKECMLERR